MSLNELNPFPYRSLEASLQGNESVTAGRVWRHSSTKLRCTVTVTTYSNKPLVFLFEYSETYKTIQCVDRDSSREKKTVRGELFDAAQNAAQSAFENYWARE